MEPRTEADLDLAELRRLLDAATPGPWVACAHVAGTDPDCPCRYRGDVWGQDRVLFQMGMGPNEHPDPDPDSWKMIPTFDREQGYANGRLIVAAVNALPALLQARESVGGITEERLAKVLADYDAGRINVPFAPQVVPPGKSAPFHRAWARAILAALEAESVPGEGETDTRLDRIKAALSINREYDHTVDRLADIERIAYGPLR